ncbi:MAG: hypothetical protein LIO91_05465, partial [Bacteroidales bacterium]|nr:hypothetical protein [Bacteroidales bacterium]
MVIGGIRGFWKWIDPKGNLGMGREPRGIFSRKRLGADQGGGVISHEFHGLTRKEICGNWWNWWLFGKGLTRKEIWGWGGSLAEFL